MTDAPSSLPAQDQPESSSRTNAHGALWTDIGGERVALLPHKALWWPGDETLFVADVHLGKAATYRAHGLPVPEATTQATLARLDAVLALWRARRIVWLGDFLHAKEAHRPDVLDAVLDWRKRHAGIEMTLVRGNHDARAGDPPARLAIDVVDEPFDCGPFAACHHPQVVEGRVALAGHLHPVVELAGRARQRLRLPCFWWQTGLLILPAFGSFTGGLHMAGRVGTCAWPVGGDRVWPAVACPPETQRGRG